VIEPPTHRDRTLPLPTLSRCKALAVVVCNSCDCDGGDRRHDRVGRNTDDDCSFSGLELIKKIEIKILPFGTTSSFQDKNHH
jgi:hypothetical protein